MRNIPIKHDTPKVGKGFNETELIQITEMKNTSHTVTVENDEIQ